jgi:hypothetical protein
MRTSPALQAVGAAVASACGVPEPRQPPGAIDWDEFVRLVDRHQVATLVARSGWLTEAGAPEAALSAIGTRARSWALESLQLLALQRDVLAALAAAGLDALVLKGPALAVDAYGDPSARTPGDLDLLVDPGDLPRAVRALEAIGLGWYGWRRPEDPDRPSLGPEAIERLTHHPLLRDVALQRDGVRVEIHWRLFENPRLMPVNPDWLRAPRRVDVQGTTVPTLPLDAHWQYALVHGSWHLWARMKWLADVAAFARRQPALAEPAALAAAPAGYRRSLATGLRVAEAAFGPFLTADSRAWASGVRGTRVLVRRSLNTLAAEHDRARVISVRALPGEVAGRLAMRSDTRYRLGELRLLLLSAGRAQSVEDPGMAELVGGPLRWVRRSVRRLVRGRG